MACTYEDCGSGNVRLSEPGLIGNTFFCNACKREFTKVTPLVKKVGLGIGATLFGMLLGGDGDQGDSGGSDT